MVVLYLTSSQRGSGKTAICAGLGKHLVSDGKKVGFFKPIIGESKPGEGADSDAAFMKQAFALEEPVESLSPVFSDESKLTSGVREALSKVSQGKDVVIAEDATEQGQVSLEIAKTLDARVIIVEGYSSQLPTAKLTSAARDFGGNLLGVVLNKVPESQLERVRTEASTSFAEAGVNILGALPEERALFAFTIGELAERVQGEILNSTDKSEELVENVMLGALAVDTGPLYFGRKANKVAVLRHDRSDMQMAALETSTRGLVISGEPPIQSVLNQAEDKKVPIILVKDDVTAIVASIENALTRTRFNQESKLPRLTEIMEEHFDFPMLYKGLGLVD